MRFPDLKFVRRLEADSRWGRRRTQSYPIGGLDRTLCRFDLKEELSLVDICAFYVSKKEHLSNATFHLKF
jgi:hypothetical protein